MMGVFFTSAALGIATWAVNDPLLHPDWQWTGAAMLCALFSWLGLATIAGVAGGYVRVEQSHMKLRTFIWYRFRTISIAPGSGAEVVHRVLRQQLVKVELLDIRSAGARRPVSFVLAHYKKADRQAIVRHAKEIARTR